MTNTQDSHLQCQIHNIAKTQRQEFQPEALSQWFRWMVHIICIVSSGDLHRLDYMYNPKKDHQTFFHNKFFIERDRAVMDCAEEELLKRNREDCLRDNP